MTTLTRKEATKLIKALEGDRLAVMFSFAIATGTRPEEYLALRWSDVDLVKGSATIQRALVRRGNSGAYSFEEPKTPKSRRTIPLPTSLVKAMSAHRHSQLAGRLKLGAVWTDLDLIFCDQRQL